jgi:peptidoglycan hydrolase CwlO-like protein
MGMINTRIAAALLTLSLAVSLTLPNAATAARKWTITQRIEAEQSRINKGEKSGELTKKEADDLRGTISDINTKIGKMKEKNAGKLSYKDEGKIEKQLNGVTVKYTKLSLEKRVTSK